jgi:hypothetical protein
MTTIDRNAGLERVVRFYETLTRDAVADLGSIYARDAWFKDPFNEVRSLDEIARIFTHMYEQVHDPRFAVGTRMAQGDDAFLTWEFRFRMKRFSHEEQCIRGATHLRFGDDGLVNYHRDYWDAAEELYEKLPVLGGLMRMLKRAARN